MMRNQLKTNLAGFLLLLAGAWSCTTEDPLFCDDSKPCSDPERPFCDVAGEYPGSDGVANTCIANACSPGAFLRCDDQAAVHCDSNGQTESALACDVACNDAAAGCTCDDQDTVCSGDQLSQCGDDGQLSKVTVCPHGCSDSGTACRDIDPSNQLAPYLDMAADGPDLVLPDGALITSDGIIKVNGEVVEVPSALMPAPADPNDDPTDAATLLDNPPAVRVFWVRSLVMGAVVVRGPEPVAIVSAGDIKIQGLVHLEAGVAPRDNPCTGAKGSCQGGGTSGAECAGGGGGGFGGAGGSGGKAGDGGTRAGGAGGVAIGNPELVPLRGGCHGGQGYNYSGPVLKPSGGLGGGAIQLVSRTAIRIHEGGMTANARSFGKPYDLTHPDYGFLAGGGGSGGGILLEAPVVSVGFGSPLVANGSGGGAGDGEAGEHGALSTEPAAGGDASRFGIGGDGAAEDSQEIDGMPGQPDTVASGGGGGGIGRIRINVWPGGLMLHEGAILSPEPSIGILGER